jgi:hypothetical protein
MAHTCPKCGLICHCGGDIDDLVFGEDPCCEHCDTEDEWMSLNYDEDEEDEWSDHHPPKK